VPIASLLQMAYQFLRVAKNIAIRYIAISESVVRTFRANRVSMAVTDSVPDQGSCVLSHKRPFAHSRQVRVIHEASRDALAQGAQGQAIPWWLWWSILSGDAPTVALAWALLFTRASGGRLSVAEAITLVLSKDGSSFSGAGQIPYPSRPRASYDNRAGTTTGHIREI
jgi:hypothetical protein